MRMLLAMRQPSAQRLGMLALHVRLAIWDWALCRFIQEFSRLQVKVVVFSGDASVMDLGCG